MLLMCSCAHLKLQGLLRIKTVVFMCCIRLIQVAIIEPKYPWYAQAENLVSTRLLGVGTCIIN